MTETTLPENDPPPKPPGCRRKKFACFVFVIMVAIIIGSIPIALHFCPWFLRMHAGMAPQDATQIELQISGIGNRVQALEAKVNELSARPTPAAKEETITHSANITQLQSDVASLASELTALQNEMKQANAAAVQSRAATQTMLAAVLAFIQLREATLSTHGFTNELAVLRNAVGSDAGFREQLARLEPYAAQGAPSLPELRETFIAHESAAVSNIEKLQAQNWWQRVVAEIKGLVSIRPLHGTVQSDAFAAVETALGKDDAAGALEAFQNLPPEAQQSLGDWRARLEARKTIDEVISALSAHFTGNIPAAQDAP